jgi:hypothetical protein
MNHLWQFGSKSEGEINAEIEENVSNNIKKTRPFGSNSFVKNYRWDHLWYYRYDYHEWKYSVQFFETMVTNV